MRISRETIAARPAAFEPLASLILMVSAYLEDVRDVAETWGARCFVKSDFLEHATDLLAEFTGIAPVTKTELV